MRSAEEILVDMVDVMPYKLPIGSYAYIIESMQLYADQFSPKWISVEDELPASGQIILAIGEGIRANYCQFNKGVFERFVDTIPQDRVLVIFYDKITHWIPLPEKP